ncbi:MAG: HAMP domain-containing histidine kinase [Planctomycetes bacterium]|nr:HAMP domain-containing histidine kinase [Planctomycetota bacterium]
MLALEDITERRHLEVSLRDAHAELREYAARLEQVVAARTKDLKDTVAELEHFSYTITHDMRAPLRAMRSFATMLLAESGHSLDPKSREYLQRIATAADRMDQLILDALDYSKTMRAGLPLGVVDAEAILRGMLETYPSFQLPLAEIEVQGPMPTVLGNASGLTQCFSNLLSNAVKFVRPGQVPHVRVWSEARGPLARIWFEDEGIGIPFQSHELIFEMFQRIDKQHEGTGIGLAIVRKVIERMGGQVGVESSEGRGSRFWVELKAGDRT